MQIGNKIFDTEHHTAVMAILNVTPDSFSDGGSYKNMDDIRRRVSQMIEEGAEIIDIGGESTRLGHIQISDEEEICRVAPVVACLKKEFDIPLSVDTYKSAVAEAAIQAGCDLINDIWGLQYDEKMAGLIADAGVSCCLMHNKDEAVYNDFLEDMVSEMAECVKIAREAGVADDKIMLDPGVGFGKTYEMNLAAINHVDVLHRLGFPILLGTSRKSVIGNTLNLPADQRVEGTLATTVIGVMKNCAFVRVHDIKENKRIIQMTKAILAH